MKFSLRAGESVDLLSPHEFRQGIAELRDIIHSRLPKDYFQATLTLEPDPSGSGSVMLYDCPLGSMVELHRLGVSSPGYTATTPLTAGNVMFWLNGNNLANFLPQNGVVAPVVFVEGTGALVVHGGENLTVQYDSLTDPLTFFLQFRRWDGE